MKKSNRDYLAERFECEQREITALSSRTWTVAEKRENSIRDPNLTKFCVCISLPLGASNIAPAADTVERQANDGACITRVLCIKDK